MHGLSVRKRTVSVWRPPGTGEAPHAACGPTASPMNKPRTLALRALLLVAFTALPLAASAAGGERPAARGASADVCAWDRPGHDPFMGDVVAAVDRYQDIPVEVRTRLKARMLRRDYDDVVSIRRDSIAGRAGARYGSTIRDMHFGRSRVCAAVSRAAWTAQMQERGLVYCDGDQCILVPTVCRNVSRITRAQVGRERAEGDVPEAVAAADVEIAPVPFGGGSPALALDAGPSFESPAAAPASDGFGYGTPAGLGSGSFASTSGVGSGSGSGRAAAARASEPADGFGPVVEAGTETRVEVAIAPVPETETWALMLGGFAALAAWRRRRPLVEETRRPRNHPSADLRTPFVGSNRFHGFARRQPVLPLLQFAVREVVHGPASSKCTLQKQPRWQPCG